MSSTSHIGRAGEDQAVLFLEGLGWSVLDRNYRFQREEVDLVCFAPYAAGDGGEIVFVEVKSRTSERFGTPENAVTPAKQAALKRVAEAYLYERKLEGAPVRFDVIAIVWDGPTPTLRHYPYAFGQWFV